MRYSIMYAKKEPTVFTLSVPFLEWDGIAVHSHSINIHSFLPAV